MNKRNRIILVSLAAVTSVVYLGVIKSPLTEPSDRETSDQARGRRIRDVEVEGAGRNRDRSNRQRGEELIKSFNELNHLNLPIGQFDLERQRLIFLIAESEGYETAIALVNEAVGSGTEREKLLRNLFIGLREDVSTSLERLSGFSSMDKSHVVAGIVQRINSQGLQGSELALLFSDKEAREAGGIGIALGVDFLNARETDILPMFDRIRSALDHLPAEDRSDFLRVVLRSATIGTPFEAWDFLPSINAQDLDVEDEVTKAKEGLLESMIRKDAPRAIEIIFKDKQLPSSAFAKAISEIYEMDSKLAEEWVQKNAGNFSALETDQIKSAQIGLMLREGNLENAENALREIQDESLRDEPESGIYQSRKKAVLNEVAIDPSGTMRSLTSDVGSPRNGLLIMESMSSWIDREPEQAGKWIKKNWDSLPEYQAQFVAASYIKDSIQQGDPQTAKQWLMHIKDPNLKKFFETEVIKSGNK